MQRSFSVLKYAAKKKLTRRDRFLAQIDSATPWGKLHKLIEPHYPKTSGPGRPPMAEKGLLMREGTIVDATLIAAPSSTKNEEGERDRRCTNRRKAISGISG
jgi:hypothetical protein